MEKCENFEKKKERNRNLFLFSHIQRKMFERRVATQRSINIILATLVHFLRMTDVQRQINRRQARVLVAEI